MLQVVEPVNDCFVAVVDFLNYLFSKKSSISDDKEAQELQKWVRYISKQKKDRTLSEKYPMLVAV